MTCHTKEELESMLEDIVNEIYPYLTEDEIFKYGQGEITLPEVVRMFIERTNFAIKALKEDVTIINISEG